GCSWIVLCGVGLGIVIGACACAILFTDLRSNNRGKIEGKWRLLGTSATNNLHQTGVTAMNQAGLYFYLRFKPDGRLEGGMGGDTPQTVAIINTIRSVRPEDADWTGRYQLRWGDEVELIDLPESVRYHGLYGNKDQ